VMSIMVNGKMCVNVNGGKE
jgi:hypothetical protein